LFPEIHRDRLGNIKACRRSINAENPLGIKTETALSALVDTALARIIWCRTFSRAGKKWIVDALAAAQR
jgi:hypothetical protein